MLGIFIPLLVFLIWLVITLWSLKVSAGDWCEELEEPEYQSDETSSNTKTPPKWSKHSTTSSTKEQPPKKRWKSSSLIFLKNMRGFVFLSSTFFIRIPTVHITPTFSTTEASGFLVRFRKLNSV
ncbi:hypothetical protein AKJ37_00030 [candidate division MSBL1 archaeon SCGC-AAA259I09]|uniref:Uncharacterized protein n=1 Tax=candidate division MSBL1 archaeon SCGC-AAA259I09 TaxID=1698267 RepID=A0A133UW24_9EURY|nr:hypothetical protein AKJ37_00030 [candidate division MSBL1 archaeon SCGC-AAA259I09]